MRILRRLRRLRRGQRPTVVITVAAGHVPDPDVVAAIDEKLRRRRG